MVCFYLLYFQVKPCSYRSENIKHINTHSVPLRDTDGYERVRSNEIKKRAKNKKEVKEKRNIERNKMSET